MIATYHVTSSRNAFVVEKTLAVVPKTVKTDGIETEGTEVSNFDSDDTIDNDTTSLGENDFSNDIIDKIEDTSRNYSSRVKPFSMRQRSSA